jgi:hypothetical protein
MAIKYSGQITGTLTNVQTNSKGEKKTFHLQMRQSNCLATIIHVYKNPESEGDYDKYIHQLIAFFVDEPHLKRCEKAEGGLKGVFYGEIKDIKLNLYYKENIVMLKHFVKAGWKVKCYYKEPKTRKVKK